VVPNDHARTVTIRLTKPDPDFLGKMALLLIVPTPLGTTMADTGTNARLLPGTGPYMITDYRADGSFSLRRNPFFHQWSSAAQPDGFPAVIRWTQFPDSAAAFAAVDQGKADVAFPNYSDIPGLRARYPDQLKVGDPNDTEFLNLNPKVPPFNITRARQAVAYALTSNPRLARFFSGAPACQLVPVSLPGHTTSCVYNPSLQRAIDLVKQLPRRALAHTVYLYGSKARDPGYEPAMRYVKSMLRRIGFHVQLRIEGLGDYQFWLYNPKTRPVSAEGSLWGPDFPAVSQFYIPVLSCASGFKPLCDHKMDALAKRAQDAQLHQPALAHRLWQRLYRLVQDQATVIPTNYMTFSTALVSTRVGNFVANPIMGPVIDQFWVK